MNFRIYFWKSFILPQGYIGFPLSTLRFSTLLHNDPAAQQDHCGSCRIRTRDHRPRSLVRYLAMSHHAHLLEFRNYVQLLSVTAVNSTVAQSEKFDEIGSGKLNAGYKKTKFVCTAIGCCSGKVLDHQVSKEHKNRHCYRYEPLTRPHSPCPLLSPPPPLQKGYSVCCVTYCIFLSF